MKSLRTAYFIVANTAILLLLVQVGAHVGIVGYDLVMEAAPWQQLSEPIKRNYAHMPQADVEDLFRTTNALRFRYHAEARLVQRETVSRFVNVDAYGIRANGKTRDITAIQNAIWMLGGSTTFGFGVADHETIPAQLEVVLKRPVVNFGVSNFSSAEENVLLNHYLHIGYRPAMAIFFDGINEACDTDIYQEEMRVLVAKAQQGYKWEFGEPVIYALSSIGRRLNLRLGLGRTPREPQLLTCLRDGRQNELRTMVARTLAERDALCALYRIECRTFVQPFAGVHGRHDDAAFLAGVDAKALRDLFYHLEPAWRAAGATFVTGALDGYDRHAWVDEVHYSADASRLIAESIAAHLP